MVSVKSNFSTKQWIIDESMKYLRKSVKIEIDFQVSNKRIIKCILNRLWRLYTVSRRDLSYFQQISFWNLVVNVNYTFEL